MMKRMVGFFCVIFWACSANAHLEYHRGARAYERGDFQAARQLFSQALVHDPHNAEIAYNLANSFYQLKMYDAAADYYRQAMQLLTPQDALWKASSFNGANALVEQDALQEALQAYEALLAVDPTHEQAQIMVERIRQELRRREQERQQDQNQQKQPQQNQPQEGGEGSSQQGCEGQNAGQQGGSPEKQQDKQRDEQRKEQSQQLPPERSEPQQQDQAQERDQSPDRPDKRHEQEQQSGQGGPEKKNASEQQRPETSGDQRNASDSERRGDDAADVGKNERGGGDDTRQEQGTADQGTHEQDDRQMKNQAQGERENLQNAASQEDETDKQSQMNNHEQFSEHEVAGPAEGQFDDQGTANRSTRQGGASGQEIGMGQNYEAEQAAEGALSKRQRLLLREAEQGDAATYKRMMRAQMRAAQEQQERKSVGGKSDEKNW